MENIVNGFNDIYSIIVNERKIGGLIEANKINLRTGEEFTNAIITNIDYSGSIFYTLTFVADNGERIIVNVNDISKIEAPFHKRVHQIKNKLFKEQKIKEKNSYLKRLCELNKGAFVKTFLDEVLLLVEDIGTYNISEDIDISFLNVKDKVIKIA
ncbi:hypothetical protein [Bacillus sp. Marseille-P3661]|uniref:hypothetical protein n=1 Tax=Bacillus sp. Marseille-P3661 TaxID=1936234 RepID=UPI000C8329EF|nr:hypothetical protein [Bacillus sp. Marseille-P3661]